jgi:hypothetical protein
LQVVGERHHRFMEGGVLSEVIQRATPAIVKKTASSTSTSVTSMIRPRGDASTCGVRYIGRASDNFLTGLR